MGQNSLFWLTDMKDRALPGRASQGSLQWPGKGSLRTRENCCSWSSEDAGNGVEGAHPLAGLGKKKGAGSWAALRAYQFLTSPLLFPGFLLQALAFLSLLAELRLLQGSEPRASHGEREKCPQSASSPQPRTYQLLHPLLLLWFP